MPDFNVYTERENPNPEGYTNCKRVAGSDARRYSNIS